MNEDPFDDGRQEQGAAADSFDALLRSVARTPEVLRAGASLAGRRFQIVRALGQGGMGVVYEALDAARAGRVALKTLTRCRAQDLYRLKNEFRSLADVAHPNLVALHEFICDDDTWFFTMDLLQGEDFLAYVRGLEVVELAQTRAAAEPQFDEERLRAALGQLVQGVVALHQAGKLHCDLKPGNVMVSKTGHLTILDFGLVSERVGPSTGRTLGPEWSGTPGYMAPEQREARELSPATDYYAIGVMLFESMAGRLPFRVTGASALRRVAPFPSYPHAARVAVRPIWRSSVSSYWLSTLPRVRANRAYSIVPAAPAHRGRARRYPGFSARLFVLGARRGAQAAFGRAGESRARNAAGGADPRTLGHRQDPPRARVSRGLPRPCGLRRARGALLRA